MRKVSNWINLFIIIMPFIDNINGIMIKFFDISLIGPFYRIILLGFLLLVCYKEKISFRIKIEVYFLILGMFIWTSIHYYLGYSSISSIQNITKVFLPIVMYIIVSELIKIQKLSVKTIKKSIIASITIYSLFIIFSFGINFKMFERTGYYGFIHAINDLAISYILALMVFLENTNYKILFLNIFAFALMGSKSMFVFIPYFIVILIYKNKDIYIKNKVKVFFIGIFMLIFGVYILFFSPISKKFFEEKQYLKNYNWEYLWKYDRRTIYRELTYGRSEFYYDFIDNCVYKSSLEWVIGSGQKATLYTLGKEGVEMDPIDSLNQYGVIGLVIYCIFYITMAFIKTNKYDKFIFIIIILYSIIGGHLFNNAISGTYYGLLLAYSRNNSKKV